ncbi:NUDIX hydrolase [Brevibacillus choshinensis]|uniref:NUDIX hydrolase n=1 Tax=Brevibacillus choshinensis TaxID=54911 RepID=UPI002E1E0AE6|nr:NUDIX domain-containing protein [Brevibacillus choshinensis]MED4585099.1 NUDIX domain-containing protein [Brevibacillus choshinensis]MED4753759.1 NUDIX domain-containing protein [Brevibacillus choshinensis]
MREEQLDIFDETGAHIGVAARSEVHRLGHWHQTFHCWIYRVLEGKIQLLFQKRHPEKDTFPDLLDITSAGHLVASEEPEDGVRELEEELGLAVSFDELHRIGVIKDVGTAPGIIDKELCHVFAYPFDQPLHDYVLQPEEVTGLVWVDLDELERLFAGSGDKLEVAGFLSEPDGTRQDIVLQVDQTAFVPHESHYYQQVFTAIRVLGNAI